MKHLIWLALAVSLVGPAFAQKGDEGTGLYDVQELGRKKCTLIEAKPAPAKTIAIADRGRGHKSRTEAGKSTKTAKVCTE